MQPKTHLQSPTITKITKKQKVTITNSYQQNPRATANHKKSTKPLTWVWSA
jgi:hypothetical protein